VLAWGLKFGSLGLWYLGHSQIVTYGYRSVSDSPDLLKREPNYLATGHSCYLTYEF